MSVLSIFFVVFTSVLMVVCVLGAVLCASKASRSRSSMECKMLAMALGSLAIICFCGIAISFDNVRIQRVASHIKTHDMFQAPVELIAADLSGLDSTPVYLGETAELSDGTTCSTKSLGDKVVIHPSQYLKGFLLVVVGRSEVTGRFQLNVVGNLLIGSPCTVSVMVSEQSLVRLQDTIHRLDKVRRKRVSPIQGEVAQVKPVP